MERRQHPRVESIHLVSLGDVQGESTIGVARTLEISQSGALLEMAQPYPLHTVFQLDIALGRDLLPVRAEVRNLQAADDGTYRVGIRFAKLDPDDMERLTRHLEAKLAERDEKPDTR